MKQSERASLPKWLDEVSFQSARENLLLWYDRFKRDLPWRELQDPWATWVSEVMLQQTRVSSVLSYFDRFMTRFPTPLSLAEAEWDEVASFWAGLGYYRRVKNLQRGAQEVVERHRGCVPDDLDAVRALTGVGAYTAGAILSIAFDREVPIVDGNVMRVFARLFRIDQDIQLSATQKLFWAIADHWVHGPRPGDFNQALMELGATVCTPKKPTCLVCPLRAQCRAVIEADPLQYPVSLKKKKALPIDERLALALTSGGAGEERKYWLSRREGEGLLEGMWSIPQVSSPSSLEALSQEQICRLLKEVSLSEHLVEVPDLPFIEHRFTHKIWRLKLVTLHLEEFTPDPSARLKGWSVEELDQLAVGGPSLKALRSLGVPLKARRGAGRAKK